MGIDNALIFNHNIHYTNAKELITNLERVLNKPVFNCIWDEEYIKHTPYPDAFDGFVIHTEDNKTLDDYLKENILIEVERSCKNDYVGHLYINPYVVMNSLKDVYLYRWQSTMAMCKIIREYGLKTFEEYKEDDVLNEVGIGDGAYVLKARQEILSEIIKLGSTKMITICSDYHDVYIDHIEEGWTFDDFISWGKKEFIFVEFKDLAHFDFPEKRPDCFNVMILDDFSDLNVDSNILKP